MGNSGRIKLVVDEFHLRPEKKLVRVVIWEKLTTREPAWLADWWALTDLNCGPNDYESFALTN